MSSIGDICNRHVAVIRRGGLVGIVTLDDVVALLAETMFDLAGIGPGQPQREARKRP